MKTSKKTIVGAATAALTASLVTTGRAALPDLGMTIDDTPP